MDSNTRFLQKKVALTNSLRVSSRRKLRRQKWNERGKHKTSPTLQNPRRGRNLKKVPNHSQSCWMNLFDSTLHYLSKHDTLFLRMTIVFHVKNDQTRPTTLLGHPDFLCVSKKVWVIACVTPCRSSQDEDYTYNEYPISISIGVVCGVLLPTLWLYFTSKDCNPAVLEKCVFNFLTLLLRGSPILTFDYYKYYLNLGTKKIVRFVDFRLDRPLLLDFWLRGVWPDLPLWQRDINSLQSA